jgi:hypothetical protein
VLYHLDYTQLSHEIEIWSRQIHRETQQMSGCQELAGGEDEECLLNNCEVSFWGNGNDGT